MLSAPLVRQGWCVALWLISWCAQAAAVCLVNVPASSRKRLKYKGFDYPLRLGHGIWDSPGPVSEVLRILLEEKLEIEVETVRSRSSTELLKKVLGCRGPGGPQGRVPKNDHCSSQNREDPPKQAWVAIEVWLTTEEEQSLAGELDVLGSMGYKCLPGMYTQAHVVDAGHQAGFDLKWWEAYNITRHADKLFPNVADLDSAIRGMRTTSSLSVPICGNSSCESGSIRPLCDLQGASTTGPQNDADYIALMRDHGLICDGGWWYSPACSSNRTSCIPVLLAVASWNMIEHCLTFRDLNLPFAVTWLGWFQLQEAVRQLTSHAFLFYWWEPDASFINLQPSRPEHLWFNDRDMRISQMQNTVKVSWFGLRHLDDLAMSNDLLDFFRKLSFRDEDLGAMLSDKANGSSDAEAACAWLLDNQPHWETWLPANRTIVYMQSGSPSSAEEGILVGVITAVAVSVLFGACIAAWCVYTRSRKNRLNANSPFDDSTPRGAWVCKWVGPHVWQELQENRDCEISPSKDDEDAWIVNASPFCLSIDFNLPEERDLLKDISQGSLKKEHSASQGTCETASLKPYSCCKFNVDLNKRFGVTVQNNPVSDVEWMKLSERVSFTVQIDEWSCTPTARDHKEGSTFRYSAEVVRKSLLVGRDGSRAGHIKLTRAEGLGLLINWSPPHESRGMPLEEFLDFLDEVVEDPTNWECKVPVDDSFKTILKGPINWGPTKGKSTDTGIEAIAPRNMYDACEHIIKRHVAPLDASFSELRTHYYPANIFISHVWGHPAERTRQALRNVEATLEERLKALDVSMNSAWSFEPQGIAKVWFCTLCNNQTRISEELGHSVWESPFARVLKTQVVQAAVMIAPFDALSRKWCNFEFGLSHKECKPLLMLEPSGLVQAGEVAPKDLVQIAHKLQDFDCENAACTNPDDVIFIDAAVKDIFGGYASLNEDVRGVFTTAIRNAHQHTADALNELNDDPHKRPQLQKADSFHTYAMNFLGPKTGDGPEAGDSIDNPASDLPGAVN